MTIQLKAIEQYFHVVLFIMLYKVVLTFTFVDETPVRDHLNESYWAVLSCDTMLYKVVLTFKSVDEIPLCDHSNKAIEQYFHMVLFIMLYKVVLTFKFVDETPVCDHSNESYWAILSCGTVCYAVQGGSNF